MLSPGRVVPHPAVPTRGQFSRADDRESAQPLDNRASAAGFTADGLWSVAGEGPSAQDGAGRTAPESSTPGRRPLPAQNFRICRYWRGPWNSAVAVATRRQPEASTRASSSGPVGRHNVTVSLTTATDS